MDFGIRGVDPEPRAGYRLTRTRTRHLQEFSDACWQRHEAHHTGHPGPLEQWPDRSAFRTWPKGDAGGVADMAFPLIVASWKVAVAAAKVEAHEPVLREYHLLSGATVEINGEMDAELLDPPPLPEVDWHETYAAELAARPAIARDLEPEQGKRSQGDGIERVLERAKLSVGEARVMRAWLYTPDLAQIAEDLMERPQTVVLLHKNAMDRLRFLGQNESPELHQASRGNVRVGKHEPDPRRAGGRHVPRAAAARSGAERQSVASRGSGPGRFRGLSTATA